MFQEEQSFEDRKKLHESIVRNYPNKIPIIVHKKEGSDLPDIDRRKYLVPPNMPFSSFTMIIRKRLKLNSTKSLFLYVKDKSLPAGNALLSELYQKHKDDDGFLYLEYMSENVFG